MEPRDEAVISPGRGQLEWHRSALSTRDAFMEDMEDRLEGQRKHQRQQETHQVPAFLQKRTGTLRQAERGASLYSPMIQMSIFQGKKETPHLLASANKTRAVCLSMCEKDAQSLRALPKCKHFLFCYMDAL